MFRFSYLLGLCIILVLLVAVAVVKDYGDIMNVKFLLQ